MNIQSTGIRAYSDAVAHFNKVESSLRQGQPVGKQNLFARTLDQSLLRDRVDRSENQGARADFISYPDQKHVAVTPNNSFTNTIKNSLQQVNELENAKAQAIEDFASGKTQNVHDLMITMQKSSMAMKMTSAVRGKILEAYKEIARMQF